MQGMGVAGYGLALEACMAEAWVWQGGMRGSGAYGV